MNLFGHDISRGGIRPGLWQFCFPPAQIHQQINLLLSSPVPPNITVTPTCVTSGSVTTCTCAASGDPQPDFYWTKYGESGIFQNGSVLTVPKEEFNDGVYLCHASNAGATVSLPFPVAVFGELCIPKILLGYFLNGFNQIFSFSYDISTPCPFFGHFEKLSRQFRSTLSVSR